MIITSGFPVRRGEAGLEVMPFFAVERYVIGTRWFLDGYRFAASYRVRLRDLLAINSLQLHSMIYPGQQIRIPH